MVIWYNGSLIKREDLSRISYSIQGYVYEGLRCYSTPKGPALFRFQDHIKRFYASAEASGLIIPFTAREILSGIRSLSQEKGLTQAYIRLEALLAKDINQPVLVIINAEERGSFYQEEAPSKGRRIEEEGIEVMVSYLNKRTLAQHDLCQVKGTKGLSGFSIGELARSQGYATALILYEDNLVGEAAEANMFWVNHGILHTPPHYVPILLGITRDSIITLAQDYGIPFREEEIKVEELAEVEEVFLTGTATGIIPVIKVGDKVIGQGKPGPITRKIQLLYQECCQGQLALSQHWLLYL
jgi:branched-chain amino acid aminotransferase